MPAGSSGRARRVSRRWSSITGRSPTRDAFDRALAERAACARRRARLSCGLHAAGRRAAARGVSRTRSSTSTRRSCPAFPGVDAQRQALEHGVKVAGATVHLVTARARRRSHRAAGRRAGARRRHAGDARRPHPDRRAPDLSRGRAESCSTAAGASRAAGSSARVPLTRPRESTGSGRASRSPDIPPGVARRYASSNSTRRSISTDTPGRSRIQTTTPGPDR